MSQSKASGRKSVAGMGSIRKKEKVINGKAYTYYEARYTVGIDPGTGKHYFHDCRCHGGGISYEL